jgi:hypothetical protein
LIFEEINLTAVPRTRIPVIVAATAHFDLFAFFEETFIKFRIVEYFYKLVCSFSGNFLFIRELGFYI